MSSIALATVDWATWALAPSINELATGQKTWRELSSKDYAMIGVDVALFMIPVGKLLRPTAGLTMRGAKFAGRGLVKAAEMSVVAYSKVSAFGKRGINYAAQATKIAVAPKIQALNTKLQAGYTRLKNFFRPPKVIEKGVTNKTVKIFGEKVPPHTIFVEGTNITAKGAKNVNFRIEMEMEKFQDELIKLGFKATPAFNDSIINFYNGLWRYSCRNFSKSTKGPTVEVFFNDVKYAKLRLFKPE